MKQLFLLTSFLCLFSVAYAQVKTPAASPTCKISQDFGLSKVDVEYSRPSAKGRKVFGDLVPYGSVWRTGANATTKLTFADDVKISGTAVPKGTYALLTIPGEKEWSVILYKNLNISGASAGKDFKDDEVQVRVTVPALTLRDFVESLTINFNNLRNSSADLELCWEYTKIVIPITTDTDAKVMASIKSTLDGPDWRSYYSAAGYYYDEKKDLNQALEWMEKAVNNGGSDKYWVLRTKANILAGLGRYQDAIATAQASSELAKKDGNDDYVRQNDKSVMEWSKKK